MLYDDLVPCGDYICHHGIKGQKWGVKNGPPYPLGASQKSPKEKRYKVSRIKSNLDETTDRFKKAHNKFVNEKTKDGSLNDYEWSVEDLKNELSFVKPKVADIGRNFVTNLKIGKEKINRYNDIVDPESQLPKKKQKDISDSFDDTTDDMIDDIEKVNVSVFTYRLQPKINCTMCVTAYELRRRGYDVMAKQHASPEELTLSSVLYPYYFKNVRKVKADTYKDFISKIKDIEAKSKNGSRGFIDFDYKKTKDGHIVNYEVVDGTLLLVDSQSRKLMDPDIYFENMCEKAGNDIGKTPNTAFNNFTIHKNVQNATPDYGAIRLLAIE